MIFKLKKHNSNLYNTLLFLSRNIFFYREIGLDDTYETRIYLMFIHYSIVLFITKNKNQKQDQNNYNDFFLNIENNLRELGFGDVSVNKKMKEMNKIFYDILLKLSNNNSKFNLNKNLIDKYFNKIKNNEEIWRKFNDYFTVFYEFCFAQTNNSMIKEIQNFKY